MDRREVLGGQCPIFAADFSSAASIELGLQKLRDVYGSRIASVVPLVAYFNFTNKENPLHESINVEGTRSLLQGLQGFKVKQFV